MHPARVTPGACPCSKQISQCINIFNYQRNSNRPRGNGEQNSARDLSFADRTTFLQRPALTPPSLAGPLSGERGDLWRDSQGLPHQKNAQRILDPFQASWFLPTIMEPPGALNFNPRSEEVPRNPSEKSLYCFIFKNINSPACREPCLTRVSTPTPYAVALTRGDFAPRGHWYRLQMLTITIWGKRLLASSGERPERLLDTRQCTGQPTKQRTVWPKASAELERPWRQRP